MIGAAVLLLLCVSTCCGQYNTSCSRKNPPPTWLTSKGHGLAGWATAGVAPTGPNFCLQGNDNRTTIEIDYHIDLTNQRAEDAVPVQRRLNANLANNNSCINKDPRIKYCIPFCDAMPGLEGMVTRAALSSSEPQTVADAIFKSFGKAKEWVVTVIKVDLHALPQAHLVCQVFEDPSWCSVYIGMDTATDSYLFEIQVARILLV